MPLEATWEPDGLHRRFHGLVRQEEIRESNDRLYGDPRFDSLRFHIADFLDAVEVRIEPQHLKILAALDGAAARSNDRIKLAIAVDAPQLIELAELYQASSADKGWQVEIFADLESARAWAQS